MMVKNSILVGQEKKYKIFSKIKNSKYNSYIIHNNCGTPDCCGQCETAIKN